MMHNANRIKLLWVLAQLCIWIMMTTAIEYVIYDQQLSRVENEISAFATRIQHSVHYANGKWDLTAYVADPQTPHPSGSGGISTPLYILTSDGLILERNAPINGYLDSINFDHVRTFTTAQTFAPIAGESWRVKSRDIVSSEFPTSAVLASIYHPERFREEVVDRKLDDALNYLASRVVVSDGVTHTSQIDIRQVDYDVAFVIVSHQHKAILTSGRNPTFIDKSRFHDELQRIGKPYQVIDRVDMSSYLAVSKPILSDDGSPIGIIITAAKYPVLFEILTQSPMNWIQITIAFMILQWLLWIYVRQPPIKTQLRTIWFDGVDGMLHLDRVTIPIPIHSYQHSLIQTLLADPYRSHTADSILKANEEPGQNAWRKVYDAMTQLNRKTNPILGRLVVLKDSHFSIAREYQDLIDTSQSRK